MEIYGRRITLDMPFATALDELKCALDDEGVAILGQADVRGVLERTLEHDFRRYALLQVAIPHILLEALRDDLCVGAVLPSTIAVFELADGETALVVSEPFGALGSNAGWRREHSHLAALADLTCARLARALTDVEQAARTYAYLRATIA